MCMQKTIRASKFWVYHRQYERVGGKANVIIHDDGMLAISSEERAERRTFYRKHRIAYVARPLNGRRGRFKKASNLNFGLNLSVSIEAMVCRGEFQTSRDALQFLLKVM